MACALQWSPLTGPTRCGAGKLEIHSRPYLVYLLNALLCQVIIKLKQDLKDLGTQVFATNCPWPGCVDVLVFPEQLLEVRVSNATLRVTAC